MSPSEPGSQFLAEIREQPRALERLLEREADIARVAAIARERGTTIRLIGHGSSDNAASYGMYAFGLLPGWTAIRDSITLTVYYKAELDMPDSTVIALSQSGQTRDVIEYVERARAAGAFTVAVTNDPSSELAQAAEETLAARRRRWSVPSRRRRRTRIRSRRSRSSRRTPPARGRAMSTASAR